CQVYDSSAKMLV
nr:immunoglobulin light chain junction region [Macaca mulatta]